MNNIVDVLLERARSTPDQVSHGFLRGGKIERECSYRSLHELAGAVAYRLEDVSSPGDRVLLLLPPGIAFIGALFGCLYSQRIAVPLRPPSFRSEEDVAR